MPAPYPQFGGYRRPSAAIGASMSTARVGPGVTAINETLYAVGGSVSGSIPLATVEAYDPATDAWTARASMPTAREQLGVAAINRMLYAVGGLDNAHSSSQFFATVEAYDPATDAWTTKAPMPTVRGFLDAGAINGIFYAVGGQNGGAMLATVEAYQP